MQKKHQDMIRRIIAMSRGDDTVILNPSDIEDLYGVAVEENQFIPAFPLVPQNVFLTPMFERDFSTAEIVQRLFDEMDKDYKVDTGDYETLLDYFEVKYTNAGFLYDAKSKAGILMFDYKQGDRYQIEVVEIDYLAQIYSEYAKENIDRICGLCEGFVWDLGAVLVAKQKEAAIIKAIETINHVTGIVIEHPAHNQQVDARGNLSRLAQEVFGRRDAEAEALPYPEPEMLREIAEGVLKLPKFRQN